MTNRAFLATCLSTTMLMGWSGAAFAQEAAPTEETASGGIAEIVVTAQKRAQNLQDVPVAVSALAGEELESRGISETSDLQGFVPSLQITTPYGRTQPNFSLRGVSVANEFSASTASPVGVYVDEVYQSFRASHGQQLYDLERVEVLRGPQGTLYGRNTTGGAISFFSNKPQLGASTGTITLGYGNYDTKTAEGALEATIIPDKLGIRFAGTFAKGDGWQYNPVQDRHVGTTNSVAGRVSLRWKPSDTVDINLKGYFARDNPLAPNPYALGQLADGRDVLGYSRFDPAQNGGRALNKNEVAADTGGRYFTSSNGLALNIAVDLSDTLSLTSITGYDTGKYRNSPFDCDGSPNSVCALRYNSVSKNFNQDLRLNYKGDRLNLVAGLYYGVDKIDTRNEIDFFGVLKPILLGAGAPSSFFNAPVSAPQAAAFVPAFAVNPALDPTNPANCSAVPTGNPNGFLDARSLIALLTDIQVNNSGGGGFGGAISAACRAAGAPPFGPISGEQKYTIKRPSAAIYFDGSYDITDALTLSVGLRYTMDKVKYLNGRTVLYDLGGTIRASTIPYTFPYDASAPALEQKEKANRLTGRVNLSYDFADDMMAYLNYSRGYRSGSFNGLAYQGTNQVYYIQPEQINAYEGGLKMRFFDRRVQLNLATFYYDYKNHQVTQVIGATTFTRSANGRLYGGEAELTIQAADSLRLDASMSLLRSKYKGNVIDPTDPSSPTRNVNGNPFPNAPRTTFSAGFDWDVFNSGDNKLTLRGDAAYTGKYYFDPFGDYGQTPCDRAGAPGNVRPAGPAITCGNPGYWLVNSRLTFEHGNYAASLWVKNLTNKYYYSYGLNIDIFGLDYLNRGTPRTYGVEVTAKF
ncbi:TonB-dependent receptor [Sphingopyxis sp. BSN-002]|uniref:TonB-dependent receptor n=1 Tax=Sphingopyxis sp. BSN-002 TaxID=2911495 RepID=UPI001EDC1590|nr:TonB-dependent receptor [Sphingopyxis sp. BSN-002]UKK84451.1 TonB-dependent receptor [Sphingopyxis sp. BSN-002]